MDEIRIRELEIYAHHGVYPQEKEQGQRFYLNVTLFLDTRPAGLLDDLEYSVNYGEVCNRLDEWMRENKYDLLETVAEMLADRLLCAFPLVRECLVEIRKPEAPIDLPFGSVSVAIRRGWHKVYLSVGSNLGDREATILCALNDLKKCKAVRGVRMSQLMETKPYGGVEQPDFLNGAIELETTMPPLELLDHLHGLEHNAGRKREIHWGPRTLDLDILFYDKLVYEDENLIIPHVDLVNREFVLKPLKELAPNFRHPILQKTVTELLEDISR